MNREEINNKVFLADDMRSVEHIQRYEADTIWILRKDVLKLTNQIYDDFESRTCDNCRYYQKNCKILHGAMTTTNIHTDTFSCSFFKRKRK